MGLFSRRSSEPAADPRADVAEAMADLRATLLSAPEVRAAQAAAFEMPDDPDDRAWLAGRPGELEAALRASMELAAWAGQWVQLEPGWAPPPASTPDTRRFADDYAAALYQLTVDATKDTRYTILVEQGLPREVVRHGYVAQRLPQHIGDIGVSTPHMTRIHMIADASLLNMCVAGFNARMPIWPQAADKQRGRVLADVYGKAYYSWMCWSADHGVLSSVSDLLPPSDDDPRVQGD